jgi:hypothetical protein
MLCTMTAPERPYDDERLRDALRVYDEHPIREGDVVLVFDDRVCCEVAGLADHWDDVLRRNTAHLLTEAPASRVVVAIARPRAELLPGDFLLWRELHQDLRGGGVDLGPVRALPAA